MRSLPPLNALKAFDASVRHLSFTKAAAELRVSQGAVSRQVQNLEKHFNVALFKRLHHQLKLTHAGEQLAAKIVDAFDVLENASHSIDPSTSKNIVLHIDGQITFTQRWLIPRMRSFCEKHNHITPNITVGDGPIDFATSDADIALRVANYSDAAPNSYTKQHLLFKEQKIAVCSPELYKQYQRTGIANFLRDAQKLQHLTAKNYWQEIFTQYNITDADPHNGTGLEHVFMLTEAVKHSLGIAVLPDFLIQEDLQKELLVPFLLQKNGQPQRFPTGRAYYLYYSNTKQFHPAVKAFKHWITQEALV